MFTQGFFDKEPSKKQGVSSPSPMSKHPYDSTLKVSNQTPLSKAYFQAIEGDDSADKENVNTRNVIADKEEVTKSKKGMPAGKKSPWGAGGKLNSQNTSQSDEPCQFMPKLSKNSMIIASSLGDPLERLTNKKKTPVKRPRQVESEEPTFTPKINNKSILIDNSKRDRSANRFLVLHEQVGFHSNQAQHLQTKREKKRMEHEQAKDAQEEQACAFHPQLVTTYAPEHLNELGFLERSYLWKKRVEQKIEVQRKLKVDASDGVGTQQQQATFGAGLGLSAQPEMIVAKLSSSTSAGPGLKAIQLSAVDPNTRPKGESGGSQSRVLQARRGNEGGSSKAVEQGTGRPNNLTEELNSFFNLDKDTVQQRKLSHKFLH